MTISYVGGQIANDTTGSNSTPINFSLTGGSNSAPSAGDVVILFINLVNTTDVSFSDPYNGYTKVVDIYANNANDTNLAIYWKVMGASPDTTWPRYPTGLSTQGAVYGVSVWRGVDNATPMDVTPVTNTYTTNGTIQTVTITPSTSGAVPLFAGGYSQSATSPTALTNATLSGFFATFANCSDDAHLGFGYRSWTSGAINSGTWPSNSSTSNSSASAAIALRPSLGRVKYWSGASFFAKPVKYWNGSSWVLKPLKHWNGSAWVKTNY